jgi:hypothetical protein
LKIKLNCFEFRSYCFISSTFHLFIDSYYIIIINKTFNKHLTSKLQVSPNFTLNSVADSNYRGKCDVGGFLIFEWTLASLFFVTENFFKNSKRRLQGIKLFDSHSVIIYKVCLLNVPDFLVSLPPPPLSGRFFPASS